MITWMIWGRKGATRGAVSWCSKRPHSDPYTAFASSRSSCRGSAPSSTGITCTQQTKCRAHQRTAPATQFSTEVSPMIFLEKLMQNSREGKIA